MLSARAIEGVRSPGRAGGEADDAFDERFADGFVLTPEPDGVFVDCAGAWRPMRRELISESGGFRCYREARCMNHFIDQAAGEFLGALTPARRIRVNSHRLPSMARCAAASPAFTT